MSDKRKSLRHIFTLGFFGAALLLIAGFLIWCLYQFLVFTGMIGGLAEGNGNVYDTLIQKTVNDTFIIKSVNDSVTKEPDFLPEEIHDSLFTFRIKYDSVKNVSGTWDHKIKSIAVFRIIDQKKIQTLVPPEPFEVPSYLPAFEVEDMNFDGYNDFRALSFVMIRGQRFYDFWLYNPTKGKFVESTSLGNLWDVEFDHKNKTVTSNQRLVGPFDVVNEVFTWENGKLVLQHREESQQNSYGDMGGDITMTKRINGKLVKRSRPYDTIPFTPEGQVIFNWDSLK